MKTLTLGMANKAVDKKLQAQVEKRWFRLNETSLSYGQTAVAAACLPACRVRA